MEKIEIKETEIVLSPDDALDYIKDNVKVHDTLEISYNRIYAPGEVLGMDLEDEEGNDAFELSLKLSGDLVNDTVLIDMYQLKDDILELRHENEEQITVVVVEE